MKWNHYILACIACLMFSCSFLNHSEDCDDTITCITEKPDSIWVDISVNDPGSTGAVPVNIYLGDADLGNLIVADTFYEGTVSYYLPIGKKYSARAQYVYNGVSTYVFDGTKKLKVKRFWNCDERCYEVPEAKIDLRKK